MFRNYFLILFNYGFYHLELRFVQPIVLNELNGKYGKFGVLLTFYHMNMYRLMVIGIEKKSKSKKLEYRRHNMKFEV